MKHIRSSVVLTVVSICLPPCPLAAEPHKIAEFSSYDFQQGKRFDFQVYEDELARTPAWRADEEFPPLSPRKADASASDRLEKLVEQADRWRRKAIELHQMKGNDRWVYVVHFTGFHPPGVFDGMVPKMRVVVLMDGRAIEPRVSPWGKESKPR